MGKEYSYANALFAPKVGHVGWGNLAFDIRKKGSRITHLFSPKFGLRFITHTDQLISLSQESVTTALQTLPVEEFDEIVRREK